jgi:hypothetical protein
MLDFMNALLNAIILLAALTLKAEDPNRLSHQSRLDELVATKGSPIIYNKQVGEYQLVWTNRERISYQGAPADATLVHTVPLEFDPFTGRKLESRRDELFTTPSEAESKEVHKKLESCKKIEDVIQQFGKPDHVWPKDKSRPASQYDFEKGFKTLKLTVGVLEDGSLSPHVVGKQIKNSVNE